MKTTRKTLLATATLLLCLGAAHTARARTSAGDIYEIRPCDQYGASMAAYATAASPITVSGTELYFNMRLWNHTSTNKTALVPWARWHNDAMGSSVVDDALNPLKLVIYVSGVPKTAELVATIPNGETTRGYAYTDFIFKYTVQQGDFALPVLLADATGPKVYDSTTNELALDPVSARSWSIKEYWGTDASGDDAWGDKATLTWNPVDTANNASASVPGNTWEDAYPADAYGDQSGYTRLQNCGFYIQTVAFDSVGYEVPQSPTGESKASGALVVTGTAATTEAQDFYVWSDNEDVVKVVGTATDVAGDGTLVQVATVTIPGGTTPSDSVAFSLVGVASNETANLVLSAFPRYYYQNGTGAVIENYITVPVLCTEPEPNTLSLAATENPTYATTNRYASTCTLTVRLDEMACTNAAGFTVTLTPSVSGDASADWRDYIRISKNAQMLTALPGNDPTLDVTIPYGAYASEPLYVYALRSDDDASVIDFAYAYSDPDGFVPGGTKPFSLSLRAQPAITAVDCEPVKSVAVPIAVYMGDALADEDTAGYQLTVTYNAAARSGGSETLTGLVLHNGCLYAYDGTNYELPKVTYPSEGATNSLATVVSPVSKVATTYSFFFERVATRNLTATVNGTSALTGVQEGDTLTVEVNLPEGETYGSDLYAFLVCTNDESVLAGKFTNATFIVCADTDETATGGLRIPSGRTSQTGTFTVLDNTESGGTWYFDVVVCTSRTYSAEAVYDDFPSSQLSMQVANVSAQATGMALYKTATAADDDYEEAAGVDEAFATDILQNQTRYFRVLADDTAYDKGTNFVVRWSVRRQGSTADETLPAALGGKKYYLHRGSLGDAGATFPYTFSSATDYVITATVWDKDDDAGTDAPPASATRTANTVSVTGRQQLTVTASFDGTLSETTTDAPYITVGLGDKWDAAYTGALTVEVAVVPHKLGQTNPGSLPLDMTQAGTAGETNLYHLTFTATDHADQSVYIDVEGLDGTTVAERQGFDVYASVMTDALLPTFEMSATNFYVTGKLAKAIKVKNEAPQQAGYMLTVDEGTNTWTDVISWGVSDALTDLTNTWFDSRTSVTGQGVIVAITGNCLSPTNFFATSESGMAEGTFTPDIGSFQGTALIYVSFRDKDGGTSASCLYRKDVPISKFLTTAAHGPSSGNTQIALGQRYGRLSGLGRGHVFVSEDAFVRAADFDLTWRFSDGDSKATVYAYGYRSGATDDGNLNGGHDIALSGSGNATKGATVTDPYVNTDLNSKDSFFYGWITAGEPGGSDWSISVAPQLGTNAVSKATIDLPTELTGDETGYVETYAEAIFSKEYRVRDNMGDINQDGVPDYYALYAYGDDGGGALATDDGAGGELVTLNAANDDEDFLPSTTQLGRSTFAPGSAGSWETSGQAFTAYREIRGLGDGLNFGMFQVNDIELACNRYLDPHSAGWVSDIDLTDNEKRSLLRHVFERRDALLEKIYAGKPFVHDTYKDEAYEWGLITNLLYTAYYAGCDTTTTGASRFRYPDAGDGYTTYEENGTNYLIRTYANDDETTVVTNIARTVDITDADGNVTGTVAVNPSDDLDFTSVNVGEWLDERAPRVQQEAAKDYIDYTWRNYPRTGEWGWTCENRTNPLMADTDDDDMPDGYEYFIWYDAMIGTDGTNRLTGCRFHLDDIESYDDIITSDEIAALYNPNIQGNWARQDTDGDGLYDLEEFLIGTSPVHWDTDRDGLSDLYEVMYGMNPLTTDGVNGGGMNADGDFMAVAELGAYTVAEDASDGSLWAFESPTVAPVGEADEDGGALTNTVSGQAFPVARFNGGYIPTTEDTAVIATEDKELTVTNGAPAEATVRLYHHQVHNRFGFDPRTAWGLFTQGELSVKGRWLVDGSPVPAGTAQNTSLYTALDEFRVMKYRYIVGLASAEEDAKGIADNQTTLQNVLLARTTNPNIVREGATLGDSEKTYGTITQHGADTDGDGVPDGWELYIGVSPNNDYRIAKGLPGYDALYHDGNGIWPSISETESYQDGLTLAQEYAGTDSCGHYHPDTANGGYDCASIYANHPSQEGSAIVNWYNKFFPTDPRNADTDGDGISDGAEYADWGGALTFNRWGQTKSATEEGLEVSVTHKSVYGNPSDTGGTCIKGGGYNPGTIDTDGDGLPDPWERQYAGLVFKDGALDEGVLKNEPDARVYDDIRAALAAYGATTSTNAADAAGYYFTCMGMDGTVEDAYTDPSTSRDVDWDGDGLQNWQEYLVQAMRHFRYDDDKTPLMGFDIPKFDETTGTYIPGAWNGAAGYPKLSLTTPLFSFELETLAGMGYPNFAAFAAENPDYLGLLGYFADPPREWDYQRTGNGGNNYKYMLPPKRLSKTRTRAKAVVNGETVNLWQYVDDGGDVPAGADIGNGISVDIFGPEVYYHYYDEETGGVYEVEPKYAYSTTITQASGYVSTDPRLWDTDKDGMDDYWELFHGLNPILGYIGTLSTTATTTNGVTTAVAYAEGARDVIANTYLSVNAWQNGWIGWDNTETPPYDPIRFPWMMGAGDCDADGDGLRNAEEALMANLTSPNTTHTDPSPLWMTDSTAPTRDVGVVVTVQSNLYTLVNGEWKPVINRATGQQRVIDVTYTNSYLTVYTSPSYTAQFYPAPVRYWNGTGTYAYSFEENEGYDTDNDFRSDSSELSSKVEATSDPQDFTDPARRQSLWFGGRDEPGAAISYEPVTRTQTGDDFFRQFTVEAWIRPEATTAGYDQYAVTRAANYGGWDLLNADPVIRLNFALGVDANGRAFAEMENSTDGSVRLSSTAALKDETWAHLAATYDGRTFTLYVDGAKVDGVTTDLAPANGISETLQDPHYTEDFPYAGYMYVPCATVIGARPSGAGAFDAAVAAGAASWDDVATGFFKGSVSEVRTWDGARTANEIKGAYKTKFSSADIKAMREEVYGQYKNGARRNDTTGGDVLPAELIQNYAFETLPGAVDKGDVAQTPAGFEPRVLAAVQNPDSGASLADTLRVGWWSDLLGNAVVGSAVYASPHTVPWIENTVGHLPNLSGVMPDSVFWSSYFAGYSPASFQGLSTFAIPNTMNPYNLTVLHNEETYARQKLRKLTAESENLESLRQMYLYDTRFALSGISDLVPLGSAFARRNSDYWDGQGAERVWAATGADTDGDELPDWWEEYAAATYGATGDITPDTLLVRNGVEMTAGEAYIRDLAAGLLPTKTTDAAYLNREDMDADGLPDWWQNLYGVAGGALGDDDHDGLSNYTEYLLSEVFRFGLHFSPVKAKSVSEHDTDYFFKIGQLYAGEIFTDHDFIEDTWEDRQGTDYASRYAWDANLDNDEDGWSNFAERRYDQFTSGIFAPYTSHILGEKEMKDMPIPTLNLTLRYNGDQPLTGSSSGSSDSSDGENQQENTLAQIVVQTFTKDGLVVPDATFTVSPGTVQERAVYLGAWSDRVVRGTLSPGYVTSGDIVLQSKQVANASVYIWTVSAATYYGTGNVVVRTVGASGYVSSLTVRGSYAQFLWDRNWYGQSRVSLVESSDDWGPITEFSVAQDADEQQGYFLIDGARFGTINLQTGAFEMDMGALSGGTISSSNATYSIESATLRLQYKSQVPVLQASKLPLSLGEANTGYVREGANTIVAFYDLDGDGKYTAGEPMGVAYGVDVGWHQGAAEIELTDTSPMITRADLSAATSDRKALYGTDDGDFYDFIQSGELSGGKYQRIRVIRTLVNGWGVDDLDTPDAATGRVLVDKWIELDQRSYFFEGDVLENGELDLDWSHFADEVMVNRNVGTGDGLIDPVEVTYRIVLGNGDISAGGTNNLFSIATVRHFDSVAGRTRPVAVTPGSQASAVYEARPVFKWRMKTLNAVGNEWEADSYTAFRVQVLDGGSVVWDSGKRRAPARDRDGVYTFEPDVYAGDGRLEADRNYAWRVSMYNAKFRDDDLWSTNTVYFRMNALTNSLAYGSIKVCARYFGPDSVLSGGTVRVEAFETPDFTGDPVARAYVADASSAAATNAPHTANATLIGLPKGTYYVRGYVDMASYGTPYAKDDWESWGYACPRDGSSADMFMPSAIVIGDELGESETVDLWIEDADTNGNNLPDAWEMVKNGGRLDYGTERIDDTLDVGVIINREITDNLQNLEGTSTLAGLASHVFSVVKNAGVAVLALDADMTGHTSYAKALLASAGVASTASATNVTITAIVTDDDKVTLAARIGAKLTAADGTPARTTLKTAGDTVYTAASATTEDRTVRGVVEYKTDLRQADWTPTAVYVTITVEADGSYQTEPFDVPKPAGAETQCFFRIRILE